MSIHDYIIDHAGFDWPTLLKDWAWLVPHSFTLWMMNRFGDLFIVLDDGSVHMLDLGAGSLKRLAESRDDFASRIDEDGNANIWLMIPLVDQLVAAGKTLNQGECYTFRIPPVLGGDYTVENSAVISISEHYSFCASIHEQIKDVPDGTKVTITVKWPS
jgi:hypothetical protein